MSQALDQFETMLGDVKRLIAHHPNFTKKLPGNPGTDEGPLLRSCIPLIYAAWEYYFEESLIEVAATLADNPVDHLPRETKKYVASNRPTTQDPWNLAGDNWRTTLVRVVEVYARGIEKDPNLWGLNTVNSTVVNLAHEKLFGVSILPSVKWQKVTAKWVTDKLDELVTLRGDIAHGKGPSEPLHLSHVNDWIGFTEKLAVNHDRLLFEWLEKQVKGLPVN